MLLYMLGIIQPKALSLWVVAHQMVVEAPILLKMAEPCSTGTVTAPNVLFNLEPDNDANYVSTTDAEGNQTRVYNGPTLDVKERLTKADTALQTLKSGAAAAVDFAELKAAIATALVDI